MFLRIVTYEKHRRLIYIGAFGSIIGGIMAMGSLVIGIWSAFVFTDKYLPMLWFFLFAVIGGVSMGALNSKKAKQHAKYRNEYTTYIGMSGAAIIFLAIYYLFFAIYKVEAVVTADALAADQVIYVSVIGSVMGILGIGLSVANSLAE